MIEFTIDKNSYSIGDVTIGQYYQIQNLIVREGEQAKLEIISELSSCPQSELRKLDTYQFNRLWDVIASDLLKAQNDAPLYKSIELDGKTYAFIDLTKLTVGEMVDMDIMRADPNKEKLVHKMMAVLYRPARKKIFKYEAEPYDSETLDERAELFLRMPMKYVYGAMRFFLQVPRSLLETTLDSLAKTETDPKIKALYEELNRTTSEWLEAGSELSPSSLETTLQRLLKLSEATLSQPSTGSLTERIGSRKRKISLGSFGRRTR